MICSLVSLNPMYSFKINVKTRLGVFFFRAIQWSSLKYDIEVVFHCWCVIASDKDIVTIIQYYLLIRKLNSLLTETNILNYSPVNCDFKILCFEFHLCFTNYYRFHLTSQESISLLFSQVFTYYKDHFSFLVH